MNAGDIYDRCSISCEIMLMIKARIRLIFSRYTKRRSVWKVETGGPLSDSMWYYKNIVSFNARSHTQHINVTEGSDLKCHYIRWHERL